MGERTWRDVLFRPLGRRRLLAVVVAGYALAALLVVIVLPTRFRADSSDTEKLVSLAAPSPEDVAYLLRGEVSAGRSAAVITAFDAHTVTVLASGEVLDGEEPRIGWVSWNGYALEHEVERRQLEAVLGRTLVAGDIATPKYNGISYRSAWLPAYVAAEVAILGAAFAIGLGMLVVVRVVWFWPLVYFAWAMALGQVVTVFAPATWDADFFYHRVVIDRMSVWAAISAGLGLLPTAAATVAGVGWLVGGGRRTGVFGRKIAGAVGALVLGVAALAVAARWDTAAAAARVDAALPCVAPVVTAWSAERPRPRSDADYTALAEALAASDWAGACVGARGEHDDWPKLYLLDDAGYVLVFGGPRATFIDRRDLDGTIGGKLVRWTEAAGRPVRTPFSAWMSRFFWNFTDVGAGAPVSGASGVEGYLVSTEYR